MLATGNLSRLDMLSQSLAVDTLYTSEACTDWSVGRLIRREINQHDAPYSSANDNLQLVLDPSIYQCVAKNEQCLFAKVAAVV